jgi:hypothetical protein
VSEIHDVYAAAVDVEIVPGSGGVASGHFKRVDNEF